MKIISTSDWHIGNLFHGNDRLPEHKHFLGWLLNQLDQQRPDALLVAGDVFDNGNPSAAAQTAYYEFLADATRMCPQMQIIITAGNHDSASRIEAPRPLLSRYKVEIRGNVRRVWMDGRWVNDYDDLIIPVENAEGEKIVVVAVPYLRSDVMHNNCYSQAVNNFLREATLRARELYPGVKVVMMTHMYAKGAEIAQNDASEKIVIGGQEEVNMEGWMDHPDYMTCGHIHKRQHVWNTDWARYTGSVLPMSFAEIEYTHGVDLITMNEKGKFNVEQLVYVPQHKLRVLPETEEELTGIQMKKLIKKELRDRGADGKLTDSFEYIVLKLKIDKVNNDLVKELEEIVNSKDAVLCKTQKIIPGLQLSTIVGNQNLTSIDDILNRDPLETLQEAFAIKHNSEMNERQIAMLKEVVSSIKNEEMQ
jgi:exonuclease SbcD